MNVKKDKDVRDYYPITTISYPDKHTVEVITMRHLEEYTPPVYFEGLIDSLKGQTRPVEGFYISDITNWLNDNGVWD